MAANKGHWRKLSGGRKVWVKAAKRSTAKWGRKPGGGKTGRK